ncbi:hypothetical protein [Haladaptatus sp. CMAA 1911]|uniref:hypothetical protein n=1 Tax=unclassified Haladaptatus TaxID=2622732 RepID=UPI00375529E3
MASDRRRNVRDDAPTYHQFNELWRTAREDIDGELGDTAEFVIVSLGLLGLRAGEISHMNRDWIDFNRGIIEIPDHDPCTKGNDGHHCGYCREQARQSVAQDPSKSFENELASRWKPKLVGLARKVPYNWNDEVIDLYDSFFETYDAYPRSRTSINRRIDTVAEASDCYDDVCEVYPDSIREHAGYYHANRGLDAYQLKEFLGLNNEAVATAYTEAASMDLEIELQRAHRSGAAMSSVWDRNYLDHHGAGIDGDLTELVLDQFVARTRQVIAENGRLDEMNTKAKITTPFLSLLGWNIYSPDVRLEYPRKDPTVSKQADYALLCDNDPVVSVEVKKVGRSLKSARQELRTYMRLLGSSWGIACNGERYLIFQSEAASSTPRETKVLDCRLEELPDHKKQLERVSQTTLEMS